MNRFLLITVLTALLAFAVTGCRHLDDVGDMIYDPITSTNMVSTPSGNYPLITTNGWRIKPIVSDSVTLAGDVAPFPWSGLASNALLAALSVGAHLRGRQWKKAAVSGVSAARAFKDQLKTYSPEAAAKVKDQLVVEQSVNRTRSLIQVILSRL